MGYMQTQRQILEHLIQSTWCLFQNTQASQVDICRAPAGALQISDGLRQVTDSDLGTVKDVVWIDGFFMTTDGEFLVVTELNDPTSVNPLKYGSSESDPDPIIALQTLRNEVYALNEFTIEVFSNRGGEGFPFQRNAGAKIPKGCVGTHANCVFMEQIAFIGSGYNEAPSVYLGLNGRTRKIATREIPDICRAPAKINWTCRRSKT